MNSYWICLRDITLAQSSNFNITFKKGTVYKCIKKEPYTGVQSGFIAIVLLNDKHRCTLYDHWHYGNEDGSNYFEELTDSEVVALLFK